MSNRTNRKKKSSLTNNDTLNKNWWIALSTLVGWNSKNWQGNEKSDYEKLMFFMDVLFGGMADLMNEANFSGKDIEEAMLEELEIQNKKILNNPEEAMSLGIYYFVQISNGYLIETIKAKNDGDINLAWDDLIKASYWAGIVNGSAINKGNELAQNARKAAKIRHAKHNETASAIKKWFAENEDKFHSLDSASERAIEKFPVSFRTARKHIGAIAKVLRSARKV